MKKNSSLSFTTPVLFLEFFVREVSYSGPLQSAQFPPGVLFYSGPSLAGRAHLPPWRNKRSGEQRREPFAGSHSLGFVENRPCLLASRQASFQAAFGDAPLDVLVLTGQERWSNEGWERKNDVLSACYLYPDLPRFGGVADCAPFRFGLWLGDEPGTVLTDFPHSEVRQTLEQGQTYLFLCRQEEYIDQYYYQNPNRNLCLFVKNHGFHDHLDLVAPAELQTYDSANLCTEPLRLRDHRKSRFPYILG
ncbi:MAG: hypothetical protein IT260_08480 [Saprospiraceae bacterium]|nr:hypothetical protein [Saprospiraceae bacterium]